MSPLATLNAELRGAVAGGRAARVAELLNAYQSEFERLAGRGSPSAPEESEAAQAALALLRRAGRALAAARAHDSEALSRLRASRRYRRAATRSAAAIELAG